MAIAELIVAKAQKPAAIAMAKRLAGLVISLAYIFILLEFLPHQAVIIF